MVSWPCSAFHSRTRATPGEGFWRPWGFSGGSGKDWTSRGLAAPGEPPAARSGPLRMALNTGPVAVGHIGLGSARRPTVVGETTTEVTALQQRAEPGTILVSGATARVVTGYVR